MKTAAHPFEDMTFDTATTLLTTGYDKKPIEYLEENKDDLQWSVTKPDQGPGFFFNLKTEADMYDNTVCNCLVIENKVTQDKEYEITTATKDFEYSKATKILETKTLETDINDECKCETTLVDSV